MTVFTTQPKKESQVGYLRIRSLSTGFSSFSFATFSLLKFRFPLMMGFIGLTMICFSGIFADKRHVSPRFSLINIADLNRILRSEVLVSEDRQLRAAHLILDFEPISDSFQEVGHVIKVGNPRLCRIDVSILGFLA